MAAGAERGGWVGKFDTRSLSNRAAWLGGGPGTPLHGLRNDAAACCRAGGLLDLLVLLPQRQRVLLRGGGGLHPGRLQPERPELAGAASRLAAWLCLVLPGPCAGCMLRHLKVPISGGWPGVMIQLGG